MRVAILSPLIESVPPRLYGGTERVVHNLCCGLTKAGIDVTLFASGDSTAPGNLTPITREALRLTEPPVLDINIYAFHMLAQVAATAKDFDVIHNHHDYWMLPLTKMTDTPFLTTLHGRLDLPQLPSVLTAFPKANFVSISDSQRGPIPHLNWARTIYHGLDLDGFKYHEKSGDYLAFLGRISPEKRPDLAIEIAHASGVPLKIAAKIEGKADQQYFEQQIKPKIDGKFIEFLGEITEREKSDFLGNALAMTFPIDWPEPFGLVMIESLACGTPVLARPMGSVTEILCDGITGFVNSDVSILAKKVLEIPSLSRSACRKWVEERFSVDRMTEEYIHVYRLLRERG